ncbi:methionine--tRNA ligase [Candidatus Micrarchaeota archaeon]|nr:methionine--tRNA ligase [Candidatus Micrarchaeota archaeon]
MPYANGPLHLGHLRSTYLPSDVYARFQRSRENDVVYVCATDEHGTPIVASAEKEKKTPQQFTDYYHEKDEREFKQLGFSFDAFHRTSSKENKEMTQHFYSKLKQNGFVYEQEIAQAYCEKCSRFLPDRFVVGTCPHCKSEKQYSDYCDACGKALHAGEIISPQCLVCGTTPTTKTTKHFFIALSKFSSKLKEWLLKNENLQKQVLNYIINWIDSGLKDWDITRELEWGVPIPNAPGKVFYVWFDAPIGYVSSTIAAKPKDWQDYWKNGKAKTIHFIGKDIIYHHFLFWPAMIMGANDNFNLPTAIPVRGYLNLEGGKFSKSKGHFVSIEDYLKEFPPDYLRYYETIITPYSTEDADWYWKDFQDKINNELVANIGNFIHRTLVLVKKLNNSEIPTPNKLEERDEETLKAIEKTSEKTAELLEQFELKDALEQILHLSSELNKFLSDREPWKNKDKKQTANTLYVCTRGVTALAVLLEPFLPFSSRKIFQMLELEEEQLKWKNAGKELLKPNTKIKEATHLFKKIPDEKIKQLEEKLKKKN